MKLVSILLIIISQIAFSQCLNTGGIGSFENNNLNDFVNLTQNIGTFELSSSESYTGSKSLKAIVNEASTWKMRIYNQKACDFNITAGESYTVSFYAKGDLGNKINVSIMNNTTVDQQTDIEITSNDWKLYMTTFKSTINTTSGKIKLIFKDAGIYYVDDLGLNVYDCNADLEGSATLDACDICSGGKTGISAIDNCTYKTITPDHPNLLFEGTLEQDISTDKARFYRMKKNYASKSFSGYYLSSRSLASSGVVVNFKTKSPSVKVYFQEDIENGFDTFWHTFDIFKNGKFHKEDQGFTIELSNPTTESTEWRITLPLFSIIELLKIELVDGFDLEPISKNKPIYVAIGNSITHGVGINSYSTRLTYPFIIADSLNYELYNWGIGASKIHDTIVSNFNPDFTPNLISILWGYNDVHSPSPASELESLTYPMYENILVRLATHYPNACILAILPTYTNTPEGENGKTTDKLRSRQKEIISRLQKSYTNISYVNGANYTNADGLNDDVHFNEIGNRNLAYGIISELPCKNTVVSTQKNQIYENHLYPNPAKNQINWSTYQNFILLNEVGMEIKKGIGNHIDLKEYSNGIYYLKLENQVQKVFIQK